MNLSDPEFFPFFFFFNGNFALPYKENRIFMGSFIITTIISLLLISLKNTCRLFLIQLIFILV